MPLFSGLLEKFYKALATLRIQELNQLLIDAMDHSRPLHDECCVDLYGGGASCEGIQHARQAANSSDRNNRKLRSARDIADNVQRLLPNGGA